MHMTSFNFSSKADTLAALSAYADLHIPPLLTFTVEEWRKESRCILAKISDFASGPLAIRSSCRREDSTASSGAGAFLSELNVDPDNSAILAKAVEKVIASYGTAQDDDQVLVQPMIENPAVTGVIMTRALADGSPYYVINYDDESGKTDTVTGGTHVSKTIYVYRQAKPEDFDSPRLASFVALARRLETICGTDALDLEFCLDKDNILHLLQVRPICAMGQWSYNIHDTRIERVAEFVALKTGIHPGLFGSRSILGVMPDWNPAEMIGILPHPLATTLYRNLITSSVWSRARERMGYRPMPPVELMPLIFGRPYIDVRASLNSFLPMGIDPVTSEALIGAWLERLERNPQLHDKIEFEVAQTALDFCFEQNMESRYPGLLNSERRKNFRKKLCRLTNACLDLSPAGTLSQSFENIAELRSRQIGRQAIDAGNRGNINDLPMLLGECRKYGTLPFSILARHAFIAESLLRSAATRGAISHERIRDFKLSVRTISGEMSDDFHDVCSGRGNSAAFMRKYGHLRPGSYDVLSPRYMDRREIFSSSTNTATREVAAPFMLTYDERHQFEQLLAEHELKISPDNLLDYAAKAIAGRELAKFIFTRDLSDILEIIAYFGENLGFDREAISFVELQSFLDWITSAWPESPQEFFGKRIEANRELYNRAAGLKLGYLIRSSRDVYVAPQHRAAPNYVGSGKANAPIISLNTDSACDLDIANKIVCIENADPGFDWIFTHNIAGLVTKFGGANSHMAIRCAEYGLPAAIGVGERLYDLVSQSKSAVLDPAAAILKI